jgi:PAS domain S-box-containing protein
MKSTRTHTEILKINDGSIVPFKWKNQEGWPVEYVAPNVKKVLGYGSEEFLSGQVVYEEVIHKEDVHRVGEEARANSESGAYNFQRQPYRIVRRDGGVIWVEDSISIQRDASGRVISYFGHIRDITGQNKVKKALLQPENYLSVLNKTKDILLTAEPDDNVFQRVVDILGPAFSASRTYIFSNHYNEEGELLTSQTAEHCADGITPNINNPELQNLPLSELSPRWLETLSQGKSIQGKTADFPQNERAVLEPQNIKAILVIPIISSMEFTGFIGFDNCISEREWNSAEQNFIKAAVNDLALFMEKEKLCKQLRAENSCFKATMNAIDAPVYVTDINTYELLFSNKAFNNLFGEKTGEKCYSVIQKGQTKPCSFCTNHLLLDEKGNPKEPYTWEFQNTITKQWYHLRDQAIHWPDGRIVRLEIATDITEKKINDSALRESEKEFKNRSKLFRLMSDNIPDLVWAKDLNGNFLFTNKAVCEKLLIAKDTNEPFGKNDMYFAKRQRNLHPEIKDWHTFGELCANSDEIVLKTKKPERFDEFGNVQGKFLYLDVYKAPIFNDNGEIIGTVGHGRIVTREKEIEKALQEQEQRLRSLINATPDIICFKDGQGRWLEANDADLELFSLKGVDYRGKTDSELAEFTDPIYREAFLTCEESDEIAWQLKRVSQSEEVIPTPEGRDKVYDVIKVPLFEDDGKDAQNLAHMNYQVTVFDALTSPERIIIKVHRDRNKYRQNQQDRRIIWHIHHLDHFPKAVTLNGKRIFVYNSLQKPAIKNIDAKYNEETQELMINMPWDQDLFEIEIEK